MARPVGCRYTERIAQYLVERGKDQTWDDIADELDIPTDVARLHGGLLMQAFGHQPSTSRRSGRIPLIMRRMREGIWDSSSLCKEYGIAISVVWRIKHAVLVADEYIRAGRYVLDHGGRMQP